MTDHILSWVLFTPLIGMGVLLLIPSSQKNLIRWWANIVGVAGLAMGKEEVRHQVQGQLQSMLGANSAKTLESMMSAQKHGTSLITTIVGIVALLFGAAGVFGQLQDALNTIWEVESKPGTGIWGFIRQRFLSLTMVLGTGFLLLVSMALTTFLSASFGARVAGVS